MMVMYTESPVDRPKHGKRTKPPGHNPPDIIFFGQNPPGKIPSTTGQNPPPGLLLNVSYEH